MKRTQIKEAIPDPLRYPHDSLFVTLQKMGGNLSFLSEEDAFSLDLDYYFNHSGDKPVSPLVSKLLDRKADDSYPTKITRWKQENAVDDDGHLVVTDSGQRIWVDYETTMELVAELTKIIYLRCSADWKRIWDAYSLDYPVLENFSVTETEKTSGKGESSKDSSGEAKSSTETAGKNSENASESESSESTGNESKDSSSETSVASKVTTEATNEAGVYGFNSDSSVPSDTSNGTSVVSGSADDNVTKVSSTESGDSSASSSGSKESASSGESSSSSSMSGSDSRSETSSNSSSGERELTRHGNTGGKSSQELLKEELDLRKYDFFARVMADVDKIIALAIYQ